MVRVVRERDVSLSRAVKFADFRNVEALDEVAMLCAAAGTMVSFY